MFMKIHADLKAQYDINSSHLYFEQLAPHIFKNKCLHNFFEIPEL